VPLILLSGIIVKFDKMHPSISSQQYVPFVGDLMASRWAYEALMVNQFKNNAYQAPFYEIERESANISYNLNYLIPELFNKINDYERHLSQGESPENTGEISGLIKNTLYGMIQENNLNITSLPRFQTGEILNSVDILNSLNRLKEQLTRKSKTLVIQKDGIIEMMKMKGMSNEDIINLKEQYFNRSVSDMVLNNNEMSKIILSGKKFIRKDSPVYQYPLSPAGRAQFYSGIKRIGNYEIETKWFNLLILWIMTLTLYLTLVGDILRKLLSWISNPDTRSRKK
jgi:hypothetical protein